MPIELKLRKIGNSLGVVLPKEALAHLKVEEGQTVYLTEAPDGIYRVTAESPEFAKQMTVAEDVIRRYRKTLRELAR
jgi:putative addiction module antidote